MPVVHLPRKINEIERLGAISSILDSYHGGVAQKGTGSRGRSLFQVRTRPTDGPAERGDIQEGTMLFSLEYIDSQSCAVESSGSDSSDAATD
jgi:hypothetical protein